MGQNCSQLFSWLVYEFDSSLLSIFLKLINFLKYPEIKIHPKCYILFKINSLLSPALYSRLCVCVCASLLSHVLLF